jgi:hypothetical protein
LRIWLAAIVGVSIAAACSLSGLSDGERDGSVGTGGQDCVDASGLGCDAGGTAGGGVGGSDAFDAPLTHCDDGDKNDDETDVDCGGSCAPCPIEHTCSAPKDCRTGQCESGKCVCPDEMVGVPTPISEGIPYCVDETEVKNSDYAAFLANTTSPAQPTECAWNDDFSPPNFTQIAKDDPELPVVNVDWCDAWGYCASIGKRLCGKLGGGAHPYTLPQSATNEWYVACSAAGSKTYVYGSAYDASACVGIDLFDGGDSGVAFPVTSLDTCQGGYPGLFDMNGNVWEWEQSCNDVDGGDATVTQCRRRGGSFSDTMSCVRCSSCGGSSRSRSSRTTNTGIRCCAG